MNSSGDSPPAELRLLIRTLLRYLAAHPEAKDSIAGVHGWWLPAGGREWSRRQVADALDHLVTEDWLMEKDFAGRKIYSLRRERLDDPARGEEGADG